MSHPNCACGRAYELDDDLDYRCFVCQPRPRRGWLAEDIARAREAAIDWKSRALAAEARVLGLVEASKPFADTPIPHWAKDSWPINYAPVAAKYSDVRRARALLSLAHGGVEGMVASSASRASEGLRPFASDGSCQSEGAPVRPPCPKCGDEHALREGRWVCTCDYESWLLSLEGGAA